VEGAYEEPWNRGKIVGSNVFNKKKNNVENSNFISFHFTSSLSFSANQWPQMLPGVFSCDFSKAPSG
jgi:hypothetical protein